MSQLLPGSIIGIIGGNEQISAIVATAKLRGYKIHSYHQADEPSVNEATVEVIGSYQNRALLFDFASQVDTLLVMTNLMDIDLLYALSSKSRYYQSFELAEISQNKVVEKLFLEEQAINVAPYGVITSIGELPEMLASLGFPAILETNRMNERNHEQLMIYDHEMDEKVLRLMESNSCMLTAFVPAKRHFSITVLRDYEDHVTILPITEDVYLGDVLKYSIASKRMNPEWVGELRTIAVKIMRALSGSPVVTIHVVLADNGIFYVTNIDQIPLMQHQFGARQIPHSMSEMMMRLATGLPVLPTELKQECVIVPIYEATLAKAQLLTVLKPKWEFEYFLEKPMHERDVLGVIRLTGESSVDLINELELSGLHDGFTTTTK